FSNPSAVRVERPRSKIKPIVADRFGHRGRHERINRQPRLYPCANLRRRNAERKTREPPSAKRRRKRYGRLARTRNGDELGEPRQFRGLAPFGQSRYVVGADEVEQFRLWMAPRVITQRVNRVGYAASFDFLVVHVAGRPAREREPEQTQSLGGGRRVVVR